MEDIVQRINNNNNGSASTLKDFPAGLQMQDKLLYYSKIVSPLFSLL